MRAPLLYFVLVLAVVATAHLVSAVCVPRNEKLESKGEEEAGTAAAKDHGGSIKPMSLSLDGYGPQEEAAAKPKEKVLEAQATPTVTAGTYVQKPVKEKAEAAAEVKKEKKEKKEKEKSGDSEESDESALSKKIKKEKKEKEKAEKKKKENSDASEEKKEKKEKKKKKKEESGENPEEDAVPMEVSTDGAYLKKGGERQISTAADAYAPPKVQNQVPGSSSQPMAGGSADEPLPAAATKKSSAATPDVYATPKQSQQPMVADSPDEPLPSAKKSGAAATPGVYATPKQQVPGSSSQQPTVADSPDEPLPSATRKSSAATPDAYATSKQPTVADSPDEPLPSAKKSILPDPFKSMKFAAGAGGGQPQGPTEPGTPKLSMDTISGMIKKPLAEILSPVIKSVCAKTEYPVDCETSIGGLPGAASAAATDTVGVLKLAMEAVRKKAVEALNVAKERMNAAGTEETTKEALSSCANMYSDMKSSLDTVYDALNRGDVDTANTNLDSVETDVNTCDDGFQELGSPSIMTDHDQELQKLTSNLLAISTAMRPPQQGAQ